MRRPRRPRVAAREASQRMYAVSARRLGSKIKVMLSRGNMYFRLIARRRRRGSACWHRGEVTGQHGVMSATYSKK